MSLEELRRQVSESGFANAVVVLGESKAVAVGESEDRGKILRRAPESDTELLSELSGLFNMGWDKLRAAGTRQIVQADDLTPAIERLLRGDPPTSGDSHMLHFPYLGILYGAINQDGLNALETHSAVASILRSTQLSLIRSQPETETPEQAEAQAEGGPTWGITRMQAPEIWDQGYTGKSVLVAHLDTGADSEHPALKPAIAQHIVFDDDGDAVNPPQLPYSDTDTHGTHTAGTIAGRKVGGQPTIGMAPDAELACGTVIESGDINARVLAGMNWALASGARIINLSLGIAGWDDWLEAIMAIVRSQQLLPVVAIGNEGPYTSRSPGNYKDTALSVGAVNANDTVWVASSSEQSDPAWGPLLCAPGTWIESSVPGGGYMLTSGSSMATAHVSGLAALLFEKNPAATIDQVQAAIVDSCENPAGEPVSRIGAGIPNSLTALGLV